MEMGKETEKEKEKERERQCKRCKQTFTPSANNSSSCRFHPSFFVCRRHDDQKRHYELGPDDLLVQEPGHLVKGSTTSDAKLKMASERFHVHVQGPSLNRPPFLDGSNDQGFHVQGPSLKIPPFLDDGGSNYHQWKIKMRAYLGSQELWDYVENGFDIPTEPDGEGTSRVLPFSRWSAASKARKTMEARAMYAFCCAISSSEFIRISACKTSKEIWETLEMFYEETTKIRLNYLKHEYELFAMKKEESIYDLSTRLQSLCNAMGNLGWCPSNEEMVRKILSVLPRSKWLVKTTIINEMNVKPAFSELVSSLTVYEHQLKLYSLEEEKEKEKKKSRNVAFTSNVQEDDKETFALVLRNFKRFLKEERGNSSKSKSRVDDIVCYGCNKPGHIKYECPQLEKKKRHEKMRERGKRETRKHSRKATTWSDEDEISNDQTSESSSGEVKSTRSPLPTKVL